MKKYLRTLFCASLVSLPGAGHMFTNASAAPLALPPATSTHLATTKTPSKPARAQAMIDIHITLPYQGQDNGWEIIFVDANYSQYIFTTDDNTAVTGFLGSVPEGVYNVYFNQNYGRHSFFDFYVGCDQAGTSISNGHGNVYRATIGENCDIITIDATM